MNLDIQRNEMATCVDPPTGFRSKGKHYYKVWQTVFEVDQKYVPVRGIGRGAYGVVCSSINVETNERVAIKKVNNVLGQGNRVDALRTLRELMLLRCIKHENVIGLRDVMMPSDWRGFRDVYMVYELMDTDLHRIINSSFHLSNNHCKYFVFQVLRGLKYLHSANILHRDLKPGNLLVNASNCELKICDFGLARTSSHLMTEYVVTRWYRAPELLLSCDNYGSSIDVWSVGCILAEILGRKPIFPGTDTLSQLRLILSVVGSQPEADLEFIDNTKARRFVRSIQFPRRTLFPCLYPHADPLAIDLLERMLVFDPSKRITVTEALSHPYLSSLYDPSCNPPAQYRMNVDVDENIGEEVIREMMLREILCYHPEAARANAM